MNIKRCLIIDDSLEMVTAIKEALSSLIYVEVFSESSYEGGLRSLVTCHFDLVILDIELHGKSGMDLISVLPHNAPPIVIVTSHPEYALHSYDLDTVKNYIVKPFSKERIVNAVCNIFGIKLVKLGYVDKEYGYFKIGVRMVRLLLKKINYIQAYGNYTKIYSEGKVMVGPQSISELEEVLPQSEFKRIHKSYIINIKDIERINSKSCFIEGKEFPIGATYKDSLIPIIRVFRNLTS